MLEQRPSLWACLVLSTAAPAVVRLACRLNYWLFSLDDAVTRHHGLDLRDQQAHRTLRNLAAVVSGETPDADDHYGMLLHELRSALWAPHTAQRRRFEGCFVDLLTGMAQETEDRTHDAPSNFDRYLTQRRHTVGCDIHFVLAEYGLGLSLSEEFARNHYWRFVHELALDHCILLNDVFSLRKEYYDHDYANAVLVQRHITGGTLQSALEDICALVYHLEHDFLTYRDAILASQAGDGQQVRTYLDALGLFLACNRRWGYLSARHHGARHVWNGQTWGPMALLPDRTAFTGGPQHRQDTRP